MSNEQSLDVVLVATARCHVSLLYFLDSILRAAAVR